MKSPTEGLIETVKGALEWRAAGRRTPPPPIEVCVSRPNAAQVLQKKVCPTFGREGVSRMRVQGFFESDLI